MLEQLINRVHNLMKLKNSKYIFKIGTHNLYDELNYIFIHYDANHEAITTLDSLKLRGGIEMFCGRANVCVDILKKGLE